MRRFKGFTLTELMVAMAVIGILVAVVTPAIMKTRPNKNKMMIKKSFYAAESIVSTLINDDVLYPDLRDYCEDDASANTECYFGFDYEDEAKSEGYDYAGDYKFAAAFKERLNVKNNDSTLCTGDAKGNTGSEGSDFCSIFYTSDGARWDLSGTKDKWKSPSTNKVGTFDTECVNDNPPNAGCGTIKIDVDTSNNTETICNETNEDCDTFEIQILANGKMRINPTHERAVNYATINTSIKDQ